MEALPEDLGEVAMSLYYSRFLIMGTLVIAILEYFQLLEAETQYMWPTKWHATKILFLCSRYLPFVFMSLFVFASFAGPGYLTTACQNTFAAATVTLIPSVLLADGVLYLRLYALSSRNRPLRVVLIGNYTVVTIICVVGIVLFLRAQNWITPPPEAGPYACFGLVGTATRFGATLCYGALLWSSTFTAALSLWYGFRLWLSIRPIPLTALAKIFYRDGILYFVVIALLAMTNGLLSLSQGPNTYYAYIFATPQAASHSLIVARMVLHLREVAEVELKGTGRSSANGGMGTSLAFASTPRMRRSFALSTISDVR